MTTPSIPPSRTRMFVPPPSVKKGTPSFFNTTIRFLIESGSTGMRNTSAGPPIARPVCSLIGISKPTCPSQTPLNVSSHSFSLSFIQPLQDFPPEFPDVPCSKGEKYVALLHLFNQVPQCLLFVAAIGNIADPLTLDLFVQRLRGDSFYGFLACRIYVEQDNRIRALQGGDKFVHEVGRPRKPVGLEHDKQSGALFKVAHVLHSRRKGRPYLRRVVTVIIIYLYAPGFALKFKPPLYPAEGGQ